MKIPFITRIMRIIQLSGLGCITLVLALSGVLCARILDEHEIQVSEQASFGRPAIQVEWLIDYAKNDPQTEDVHGRAAGIIEDAFHQFHSLDKRGKIKLFKSFQHALNSTIINDAQKAYVRDIIIPSLQDEVTALGPLAPHEENDKAGLPTPAAAAQALAQRSDSSIAVQPSSSASIPMELEHHETPAGVVAHHPTDNPLTGGAQVPTANVQDQVSSNTGVNQQISTGTPAAVQNAAGGDLTHHATDNSLTAGIQTPAVSGDQANLSTAVDQQSATANSAATQTAATTDDLAHHPTGTPLTTGTQTLAGSGTNSSVTQAAAVGSTGTAVSAAIVGDQAHHPADNPLTASGQPTRAAGSNANTGNLGVNQQNSLTQQQTTAPSQTSNTVSTGSNNSATQVVQSSTNFGATTPGAMPVDTSAKIQYLYSMMQNAGGQVFNAATQATFGSNLVNVFDEAVSIESYVVQLLNAALGTPLLNATQQNYVKTTMLPNLDQISATTRPLPAAPASSGTKGTKQGSNATASSKVKKTAKKGKRYKRNRPSTAAPSATPAGNTGKKGKHKKHATKAPAAAIATEPATPAVQKI